MKLGATRPLMKLRTTNHDAALKCGKMKALKTCTSIITSSAHPRRRSIKASLECDAIGGVVFLVLSSSFFAFHDLRINDKD